MRAAQRHRVQAAVLVAVDARLAEAVAHDARLAARDRGRRLVGGREPVADQVDADLRVQLGEPRASSAATARFGVEGRGPRVARDRRAVRRIIAAKVPPVRPHFMNPEATTGATSAARRGRSPAGGRRGRGPARTSGGSPRRRPSAGGRTPRAARSATAVDSRERRLAWPSPPTIKRSPKERIERVGPRR